MSDYGADGNPSIPAAQDLAFTKGFVPLEKTNVMQWTYPDDITVRKLANKRDKTNVLFKLGPPQPDPPGPPPLDPVPAGDACVLCWGNGKPFGVGETPESVTVVVEGIEKGPDWIPAFGEPPNGTFILPQAGLLPCVFRLNREDDFITIRLFPTQSIFAIIRPTGNRLTFQGIELPCKTFFINNVTLEFVGGTATIFIPPIA